MVVKAKNEIEANLDIFKQQLKYRLSQLKEANDVIKTLIEQDTELTKPQKNKYYQVTKILDKMFKRTDRYERMFNLRVSTIIGKPR